MIKIWDEELTQIRLRELQDKGVAVEIVGKGDLMQITEGWIHFSGLINKYQLAGYIRTDAFYRERDSLRKEVKSLKEELARYVDAAFDVKAKKLEGRKILWSSNYVSLAKNEKQYSVIVSHGLNTFVKGLSQQDLIDLGLVINKELNNGDS